MPVKIYKPNTAGRRISSVVDYSELTKKKPEKSLLAPRMQRSGRNNRGVITVRHRGGGHKRFFRLVDAKRENYDVPAKVLSLEYDPNRSAWLALLQDDQGRKSYIIAPAGLRVGEQVVSSQNKTEIKPGNRLPLSKIPVGIMVYDLQLSPKTAGTVARSAGAGAIIQALEGDFAQVKLPSGEIRMFHKDCMATIGQASNIDHENVRLGKAGRTRWMGRRPEVRGKAMNPVDHPHGGGEGHNPIGLKHPKTLWGKPALGVKTRKKGKYSDKFIIKRRK